MHAWIEAKVASTKLGHYSFFRSAYFYTFQKELNSQVDVVNYKVHGTIPVYVANWVRHLQVLEGKRNGLS